MEKIVFTAKIWKSNNRYIIKIPKEVKPLLDKTKPYKVILEEISEQ